MATVHFPEDDLVAELKDGGRLQDAIDASGADIPFGCREGNCATCMIHVVSGKENLNPVTEAEEITLMPDEIEQGIRLACQCIVKGGEVSVRQADAVL